VDRDFSDRIKADILGPLRYLLITLKPLRGSSVGVQPPTDAEKSPLKKRGTFQIRLIYKNMTKFT
jgi:hypothetical protein